MDISLYFTPEEIDALGEIGNICMGNSATALNMMLGRKVTITTPSVGVYEAGEILSSYDTSFLAINVEFTDGLFGKNLLLLKDYDAALITDLLMGGDGNIEKANVVLTEIHMSAIGELMNQMMGSAATAMSNMMGNGVAISPPTVFRTEADENVSKYLDGTTPVVQVSFDMEIEGLLKSKLLQVMSIEMAREEIRTLMHMGEAGAKSKPEAYRQETGKTQSMKTAASDSPARESAARREASLAGKATAEERQQVRSVKSATYESFDPPIQAASSQDVSSSNFDLINDIPLQVMVELGRTRKNLGDVLNFGIGSIIVLDKQAGELVDVIVNGKRIAKGEVVVVDENYGVRITELVRG